MGMNNDEFENDQTDFESSNQKNDVDRARRNVTRAGLAVPVLMSFSGYSPLANAFMTPSRIFSGNASPQAAGDPIPSAGRSPGYWKACQHLKSWSSPHLTEVPAVYVATTEIGEQKGGNGGGKNKSGEQSETTTRWEEETRGGPGNYREFQAERRSMLHYGPEFGAAFPGGAQILPLPELYQLSGASGLTDAQLIKPRTYGLSMWELLAFPAEIAGSSGVSMEVIQLARHLVAAHLNIYAFADDYPLTDAILNDMWEAASMGGEYFPNGIHGTPGSGWSAGDIVCYLQSTFDSKSQGDDDVASGCF